jgi:hypothetical protein
MVWEQAEAVLQTFEEEFELVTPIGQNFPPTAKNEFKDNQGHLEDG